MQKNRFANEQYRPSSPVMRVAAAAPAGNLINAQNSNGSVESQLPAAEQQTCDEAKFIHSPDEIARVAYFTYLNEGSKPGRDVQHWLAAEDQLLAERKLTRSHGFHNRHN